MIKKSLLVLLGALLLLGCTEYKKIGLSSAQLVGFTLHGTSRATLEVELQAVNAGKKTITLESMESVIRKEGKDFVLLTLKDPITLEAGRMELLEVELEARVLDPLILISSGMDFRHWQMDDFSGDAKLVFRSKSGKFTYKIKNKELSSIIAMYR